MVFCCDDEVILLEDDMDDGLGVSESPLKLAEKRIHLTRFKHQNGESRWWGWLYQAIKRLNN